MTLVKSLDIYDFWLLLASHRAWIDQGMRDAGIDFEAKSLFVTPCVTVRYRRLRPA